MKIEQAQAVSISEILKKMLCKPKIKEGKKSYYFPPYRASKGADLEVDTDQNTWFDPVLNRIGSNIELVQLYLVAHKEHATEQDALRWIKNMIVEADLIREVPVKDYQDEDKFLEIADYHSVIEPSLIRYAEQRGIPREVTNKVFHEARIFNRETKDSFLALAVRNEDRGYEVRNPFVKACVGKKSPIFIRGTLDKPSGIHVFKDMFDFATMIVYNDYKPFKDDSVILTSLNCLRQSIAYIRKYGYQTAYTWQENNKSGIAATKSLHEFFRTEEQLKHMPMQALYAPYQSVNDWHIAGAK